MNPAVAEDYMFRLPASVFGAIVVMLTLAHRTDVHAQSASNWYETFVPKCTAHLSAGVEADQNSILQFNAGQAHVIPTGKQYIRLNPNDYNDLLKPGRIIEVSVKTLTATDAANLASAYKAAGDNLAGRGKSLSVEVAATVVGLLMAETGPFAAFAYATVWTGLNMYLTDYAASDLAYAIAHNVARAGILRNVIIAQKPNPPLKPGQLPDQTYVIWAQEYRVQIGAETRSYQLKSCRYAAMLDYQMIGSPASPTGVRIISS